MQFTTVLQSAGEEHNPSRLATYVYDLARLFCQFYQKHSVLNANSQNLITARLSLVQGAVVIIKQCLNLLGIDVLEEM